MRRSVASFLTLAFSVVSIAFAEPPATQPSPTTSPVTLPAVEAFIQERAADHIILAWKPVPSAARYCVYQLVPDGEGHLSPKPVSLLDPSQTSMRLNFNLPAGQQIIVGVLVVGPAANPVQILAQKVGDIPEKPALDAKDAGTNQMVLTFYWRRALNATDYLVQYQTRHQFAIEWDDSAPITDVKLKANDLHPNANGDFSHELSRRVKQPYRFRVTPKNDLGPGTTTKWVYWPANTEP